MQNDSLKVVIAQNAYGCFVEPARIVVRTNSRIEFKVNESVRGTVRVELPKGCSPMVLDIPSGASDSSTVTTEQEGVYQYGVTCTATGLRARGASEPEIIVDN